MTIEQTFSNNSFVKSDKYQSGMPVHTGFHPYFRMSGKLLCHNMNAREYFDYNDMKFKLMTDPYDAGNKVEASVVSAESAQDIIFYGSTQASCKIRMGFSPEYKYIMLWSADGGDFVCVEPWTARNQEILRGDELIWLAPGEDLHLYIAIEKLQEP